MPLSAEERELFDRSIADVVARGPDFAARISAARAAGAAGSGNWGEYAALGWLGIAMAEADGGAGGGQTELGILMAAAGRHLLDEPLLANLALAASAIALAGNAAQRALLGEIADGSHLMAFCHADEDSGWDRAHLSTTAQADGGGHVLTGRKTFVPGAHLARTIVVSARRPDGTAALFLVPADGPGVSVNASMGIDGRWGGAVALDGVVIGAQAVLGVGDQAATIDRVVDRGVAAVSAEACGAMAAVNEMTVAYLKERRQFGRPLSDFQVLQHRLVDMNIAAEEARAVTHAALAALDSDDGQAQRLVWQAKVQVARAAGFVGSQGIQLHGGMGMTDDLAIGHYYKRLTVCQKMFGDAAWYLERLAERAA